MNEDEIKAKLLAAQQERREREQRNVADLKAELEANAAEAHAEAHAEAERKRMQRLATARSPEDLSREDREALPQDVQERLAQMQSENDRIEPDDVRDQAEEFAKWLDSLVPDARTVEVEDIAGVVHQVTVMAAAKKQVRVTRRIRRALAKHVDTDAWQLDADSVMQTILNLVEDEDVFDAVVYCFEQLCRHAVREARKGNAGELAVADWLEENGTDDGDVTPYRPGADELFPIEEMVAGILPFSGRLVRRIAGWTKPGGASNAA